MKRDLRLLYYILKNWWAYSHSFAAPVPVGYVIIGITYECNAKCKMCDIHQLYKVNPQLSRDEVDFSSFLKRLQESKIISKIKHIDLTGGEPFLKQGLADFIIGIFNLPRIELVTINTNGFLARQIVSETEKILKFIPKKKKFSISVSIDGVGQVHDRIRGIPQAFSMVEKTIAQLEAIRSAHDNFTIRSNAVIQKDNIDSLAEIKEYWLKHGIEGAYGLIQNPFYTCRTQTPGSANLFNAEDIEKIKKAEPKSQGLNYYLDHNFNRPLSCFAGYSAMFIEQWGAIYPCNFLSGNRSYEMGNIKNEPIDSIWKSPRSREVRAKVKKCPYTGCWNGCEVAQTMVQHEPIERIARFFSFGMVSYYRNKGLQGFK